MLVALATAKRPASLALLSIKEGFCEIGQSSIRFQPVDLERTEGIGHCAPPLMLTQFTEDPRLCPVFYLKAYMREENKDVPLIRETFCLSSGTSWGCHTFSYC